MPMVLRPMTGVSSSFLSFIRHSSAGRIRHVYVYPPQPGCSRHAHSRSGNIGVVVDAVTNPFYPEVIAALSAELAAHDLRMLLFDADGAGERGAVLAIRQRLVDGLVFTTATPSSAPLAAAFEGNAPLVLVNRVVDGARCDQVDTDNATVSQLIAGCPVGLSTSSVSSSRGRAPRGPS